MERLVIAAYKPKPGMTDKLNELTRKHMDVLRKEDLVSSREAISMVSEDGTIVEVFGWKSKEAIEAAHSNPNVLKMWDEYFQACDFIPIAEVAETKNMFSEFTPFK